MSPADLQTFMQNRSTYSVGATHADRVALDTAEMEMVEEGMITGLAGVLLVEGASIGSPVVSILTEANPMFPDVSAAVVLLEEGAKLSPDLEVDLTELKESAKEVEGVVKDQVAQTSKLLEARMDAGGPEGGPVQKSAPSTMYG